MQPSVREVIPRAVGWPRVDLLVSMDDRLPALSLSHSVAQVGDEFLQCDDLSFGGGVAVEVSDEADAEGDVVEVVAGHVTAVDLPDPAVADLDLAVARTVAIADHEVVGQAVLHVPHPEVVDVKDPGVPLTGAAVVDDDIFPSALAYRGAVDRRAVRGAQVAVGTVRTKEPAPEASASGDGGRSWGGCWLKALCRLQA